MIMNDVPMGGISKTRLPAARHEPGRPHGYIRVRFVDYMGIRAQPTEARARPLVQAGVLHKPLYSFGEFCTLYVAKSNPIKKVSAFAA